MRSTFETFIPLALLLAFYTVAMVWRNFQWTRRYGKSGLAFLSGQRQDNVLHLAMTSLAGVQLAQAAVYAVRPDLVRALEPVPRAIGRPSLLIGSSVVLVGLVLINTAQRQMGASWRMGIDYSSTPELVSHGLYRYTRNPIALGLMVAMLGFTIVLPTYLSLVMLPLAVLGLRLEVAREERHLRKAYGARYERYRASVGRFLPVLRQTRTVL